MVTEWSKLGFLIRNPYRSDADLDKAWDPSDDTKYVSVERSSEEDS